MTKESEKTETTIADLKKTLAETSEQCLKWFEQKASLLNGKQEEKDLYMAFSIAPRALGKEYRKPVQKSLLVRDVQIQGMEAGEVVRILLLLAFQGKDKEDYIRVVTTVFHTADLKELELLYRAINLLPFSEDLGELAAEGVRSNMVSVFDAISQNNSYPCR